MIEPNKDLLLHKILHSRDLTALEKWYLEGLVERDPPLPRNVTLCVCCGAVIPEGRQICPRCEEGDTP